MTETVNLLPSKPAGCVFRRKPSPAARAQAIFTANSGLARTIFGSNLVTSIIWSIELAHKNFHNGPQLRQFNGRCVTDQMSAWKSAVIDTGSHRWNHDRVARNHSRFSQPTSR